MELVTKSWHRIESPGQADVCTTHSKVLESEGVVTNESRWRLKRWSGVGSRLRQVIRPVVHCNLCMGVEVL